LKTNQVITLGCNNPDGYSDGVRINLTSKDVPRLVKPNDIIYVDDGKIILLVLDCDIGAVRCEVKAGGILGSNKIVKLPTGKQELLPILAEKDVEDLNTLVPQ
jgi:pyruvate kinase